MASCDHRSNVGVSVRHASLTWSDRLSSLGTSGDVAIGHATEGVSQDVGYLTQYIERHSPVPKRANGSGLYAILHIVSVMEMVDRSRYY